VNIVVLSGGTSTEREVSLSSGKEIYNAIKDYEDINAILLDVSSDYTGYHLRIDTSKKDEVLSLFKADIDWVDMLDKVKVNKENNSYFGINTLNICSNADVVFLALHGMNGEDGKIQAAFDLMGIKYTGTDYISSVIAMDKAMTKREFERFGIKCAHSYELFKGEIDTKLDNNFPKVIKVANGGSSIGVYIVYNKEEYNKSLKEAFEIEDKVIIEDYVAGREFSVGVIDGKALPIIEIIPNEGFYDYETKYTQGAAKDVCPAEISESATKSMQEEAVKVFKALRLKNYARIDFLMDEDENIYCLEANTLPGMTPTSLLPQEALEVGMSFGDLCRKIIEVSLK